MRSSTVLTFPFQLVFSDVVIKSKFRVTNFKGSPGLVRASTSQRIILLQLVYTKDKLTQGIALINEAN